jgi:hypothetical protein
MSGQGLGDKKDSSHYSDSFIEIKMKDTPNHPSPNLEEQFNLMADAARIKKMRVAEKGALLFILGQLANPHPYLARTAVTTLAALYPPASLPERWNNQTAGTSTSLADVPEWLIQSCGDRHLESMVVHQVLAAFDQLDLSGQERFLSHLAGLTGLAEMVIRSLSADRPELAKSLQFRVARVLKGRFPAQINFAPTMSCQLSCPYCVSGDLKPQGQAETDPETVSALLDWVQKSNIGRIGLAGGEPTLY